MRQTFEIRYFVDFEGEDEMDVVQQATDAMTRMSNGETLMIRRMSVGFVANLERALQCDCATRVTLDEAEKMLNS